MPINSSSIPSLRVARAVRRRKRAGGGGIFDWSGVGEAMPEHIGRENIMDPAVQIPKSMLWDLPHRAIDAAKSNPMPGLRREDYTDLPPEEGRWGGSQPVEPMVGASLEAGLNTMGGTALSAPARAAGEVVTGAGPVRRGAQAALDVSPEAAAARATEQGFDVGTPRYHGTSKDVDFKKFNDSRHGTWTATDPAEASMYAANNDSMDFRLAPGGGYNLEKVNDASRVLPLYAKPLENPYKGPMPDELRTASNYKRSQSNWFDTLKREGYDGWEPGNGVRVDFNSANLRSTFAPFDPKNKDKSVIFGAGATDKRAASLAAVDDILANEKRLAGAIDEPRPAATTAIEPAAAADPGAVGPGGGGPAGARGLPEAQATAARWAGERKPLEGIPGALKIGEDHFVPGPIGKIHDVAEDYMRTHHPDRPYTPPERYHPVDPEHSKAIAQAYEEMKHTPNDPATKASYDALIDETAKQYQAIKKTGLKIEPIPPGMADPYATNPRMAAIDVAENNHLWFFPTEGGFGTVNKITDNPMLRNTGEKIGDHEMLANDMFRVVHDYFGHLKQGHGFRAPGEDNAWRGHSAMYSDLARPAMTTETRGQNSWVNYGPHGEKNRTASGADTTYADQKVGLMPEWTMRDRGSPEPIIAYHGSPHSFDRFDSSHMGAGEGNQSWGQGLYFAGHSPVSEWYRHQLAARRDPILGKYGLETEDGANVGMRLANAKGDPAVAIGELENEIKGLRSDGDTSKGTQSMIARRRGMVNYLNDPERNPGHMYQVAIDAKPEQFLDWDASLQKQPQHVQEWIAQHPQASRLQGPDMVRGQLKNPTGEGVFRRLRSVSKDTPEKDLAAAGVKGIRYLDQGSRVAGGGSGATHNYVTFDDNMLRILRKYGIAGIPAAGVLGADGEERRARGGRVARRLGRKHRAGGGAAFGVMSPAEEAELDEPAPLKIARSAFENLGDTAKKSFESSESMRRGEGYDPAPLVSAALGQMGAGWTGAPVKAGEMILGSGPVRRVADDTGAAMTVARKVKQKPYAEPEYTPSGTLIINKGAENPPNPAVQTVADPHRMMYPGIYRNPRIVAEEAAARVGPEDPAMKQLFGVTRGDLREMSKGRVGNEEPNLRLAKNPKGSVSAQNIQTPQNTQRLQDILGEAGKHEGLRTADAWYLMDPVYKRMAEMFGPEEAVKRYRKFNTTTAMASPGSDVMTEIQRGTGAHWLQNQGRFDDFKNFAGVPEFMRSRTAHYPQDMRYIGGHPYHRTSQSQPMQKYFDAGSIQSDSPKVPLYAHASGVPETGFQTTGPVGDAHFSRGVGLSDTRKGPSDVQGSFSTPEYQTLKPWWQHEVAGPSGLESVPAQARLWTALGPQTGVDSALGAPKLELLAKQIMVASKRLRISPEQARDLILSGGAGAGMLGGVAPMMDSTRERAAGGSVDAAMEVARRIKRNKGGKVHVGPIVGDTDGRADEVPMEVPDGAYVLTADHCSAMGEGNTLSGFKKLNEMFPESAKARTTKKEPIKRASGGKVPIYAADGEYVVCPEDILKRWGSLDEGHRILDAWQTTERKEHIKTLGSLAPPAQD